MIGTRFGIELAEPVKRGRELFRQDREIALDKTVGDAGGGGGHAGAVGEPRLPARKQVLVARGICLHCRQNSHHDRPAYYLDSSETQAYYNV